MVWFRSMEVEGRLASRIRNATAAVLGELSAARPTVRAHTGRAELAPVFDVVVAMGKTRHPFRAGWAGTGWRPEVERLLRVAPQLQVVYAERLSEDAKAWLVDRHIGWVDEDGAARISLPTGLLVLRDPREITKPAVVEDRWTKTMLAAAEAILAGVPPTVAEVEQAARISRGATANALDRLEKRGVLERPDARRGRGVSRRVADIDALIDEYAEAAGGFRAKQKVILLHRLWKDPLVAIESEIGPALRNDGATWAISGAAASTLLAPYLGDVTTIDLYVDAALFTARDRLSAVLGGRVVERGHRIEVRELPTSMSANGLEVGGIQLALPARVYADLLSAGGRSAEAAHHLREVRGVGPGS